jgi:mono/diheme cytochrome c family protein
MVIRKILKWVGIVLGVLLVILIVAGVILNIDASNRINRTYDIQAEAITIPTDDEALARGEHLARVLCIECHGGDLGGDTMVEEAGLVTIHAPNLTPGEGGISDLSDEEVILAMRHGIRYDGKPLFIMPAETFIHWSEEDLAATIAYLRSLPPSNREYARPQTSVIARALLGLGMFGEPFPAEYIDHDQPFPEMPEVSANEAYGEYLARAVACTLCHGDNLAGGITPANAPPGEFPTSPNLTPAGNLVSWSEEDFLQTLQTGIKPNGEQIDPDHMPWDVYARLDEPELQALWLYIQSLPAADRAVR